MGMETERPTAFAGNIPGGYLYKQFGMTPLHDDEVSWGSVMRY